MLSYLARQLVALYPVTVGVMLLAGTYFAVSGRWGSVAFIVIAAVLAWFQHLFARWWIGVGEDNDVQEWLNNHPEHDTDGESGPA